MGLLLEVLPLALWNILHIMWETTSWDLSVFNATTLKDNNRCLVSL